MKFSFRTYQEKGKEDIQSFLDESSYKKGICVKPVGSGKSIDTAIISDLVSSDILVIQPNVELLEQNVEKARAFGLDPSIYSASANSKNVSSLTYATPMSLISDPSLFKKVKTVVIDEAHLNTTNSLKNGKIDKKGKLNLFLEYINPDKIIGLTATPIQLISSTNGAELRMVNRSRRSFWNQADIFHTTQINDICDDYWADLDYRSIGCDESGLVLNSTGNEFILKTVISSYEKNNTNSKILEQYEQLRSEGKKSILTFIPSIEFGLQLLRMNPDFEMIYDKTPKKERADIVRRFKNGEIPNLINCETLTTGFDFPELDGIIIARHTNSFALYYQIIGRIVRPIIEDGKIIKKKGTIVDLTNNFKRFGKVENITFEKQDYTKGWAMWNGDNIMTGVPFGDWKTPTRKQIMDHYEKTNYIDVKRIDGSIQFYFGKYKGKTTREVFNKDKGYIMWLLNNEQFRWDNARLQELKKSLENLIKENIINN